MSVRVPHSKTKALVKSLGLLALMVLPLPYVGLLGDWRSFFCGVWAAVLYRYYWRTTVDLGYRYLTDNYQSVSDRGVDE